MDGFARPLPVFVALLFSFASATVMRADGTLDEVRREVRESSSRSSRDRDDDWDDDDDCDESLFGRIFGPPIVFALSSPWWGPHVMLDDDFANWADFAEAPYADGHDGFLLIESAGRETGRVWTSRLTVDSGHDFDDLHRIGTRLVVDTSARLGFDTEWNQWVERVPGGHDSLSTGDFNVVIRFAQQEQVQFHSGLGFNWLADADDSEFGFNFTYGVDLFPHDPWIVSSTLDLGTLGGAGLLHSRTSVGVIFGGVEVFTGFDYQRIGSADLHGLTAGLRFWY